MSELKHFVRENIFIGKLPDNVRISELNIRSIHEYESQIDSQIRIKNDSRIQITDRFTNLGSIHEFESRIDSRIRIKNDFRIRITDRFTNLVSIHEFESRIDSRIRIENDSRIRITARFTNPNYRLIQQRTSNSEMHRLELPSNTNKRNNAVTSYIY